MRAPPVGGTARALGIHLGLASTGLDLHFGEGFAEKNPVLVVVAASLLLHQQATGEGLQTIKDAIGDQQDAIRESFEAVGQAIGANRHATCEGVEAVCEAVAELAVVIAGLNA